MVCYHCERFGEPYTWHPKRGGCWTGIQALGLGKPAHWHVVANA